MGILVLPRPVFSSLPSSIRGAGGRGRRDATKRERAAATATAQRGPRRRRSQNVEGEFFVGEEMRMAGSSSSLLRIPSPSYLSVRLADERCIDCDACRWMAPVRRRARFYPPLRADLLPPYEFHSLVRRSYVCIGDLYADRRAIGGLQTAYRRGREAASSPGFSHPPTPIVFPGLSAPSSG